MTGNLGKRKWFSIKLPQTGMGGAVYSVQIVLSRDHGDSLANGVTGLPAKGTGKRQSHPMRAAIRNIDRTEHEAPI